MGFGFEKLEVYKSIRSFNKEIYKTTEAFPRSELYGLISQIRRASISILANIAEGSGRRNKLEQRHFYSISRGSLYECIALLDIALDLKYIDIKKYTELKEKAGSILARINGLLKYTSR